MTPRSTRKQQVLLRAFSARATNQIGNYFKVKVVCSGRPSLTITGTDGNVRPYHEHTLCPFFIMCSAERHPFTIRNT